MGETPGQLGDKGASISTRASGRVRQRLPRPGITGTGGLAQQLLADAPIPLTATVQTQQQSQAPLRLDQTAARRALEQTARQALHRLASPQAGTVQQPAGQVQGQPITRKGGKSRQRLHGAAGKARQAAHSTGFFQRVKTCQESAELIHAGASEPSTVSVDNFVGNSLNNARKGRFLWASDKLSIF